MGGEEDMPLAIQSPYTPANNSNFIIEVLSDLVDIVIRKRSGTSHAQKQSFKGPSNQEE